IAIGDGWKHIATYLDMVPEHYINQMPFTTIYGTPADRCRHFFTLLAQRNRVDLSLVEAVRATGFPDQAEALQAVVSQPTPTPVPRVLLPVLVQPAPAPVPRALLPAPAPPSALSRSLLL